MGVFNESKDVFTSGAASRPLEGLRDAEIRSGTLILLDTSHSLNPPSNATAVPTQGSVITLKNIASFQAAEMTAAAEDDMDCKIISNFEPADIKFQRTPKGALYGVCSRSAMQAGRNAYISAADEIRAYVLANPLHRYFFSIQGFMARKALYSPGNPLPLAGVFNETGSTINYQMLFTSGDDSGTERGRTDGAEYGFLNDPANPNAEGVEFYRDGGSFRWTNNKPGDVSQLDHFLALWGGYGAWASIAANKAPSWALRRVIFEDLTVSGIGYDRASYLGRDLWQRNCAVGGRWNGDVVPAPGSVLA